MAKTATASEAYANDDEQPDEAAPGVDQDDHDRLLRQFDTIAIAEQDERAQALEDRRFVSIAGAQWEGDWGDTFENSIKVEIDKTSQGVERIMDQYRANRMLVNFRAVDKGASEDTAETLNGMFRADFYRSGGQEIGDNAFEEAVQGGYGAFRLTNEYADEYDPDDDAQHICFKMITDADQSVWWIGGKSYSKRDATGCYVICAMTPDEFDKAYPEAEHSSWPQPMINRPVFDWFTPEVIRVAEYYEVEEIEETLRTYENVASGDVEKVWVKDQAKGDHVQRLREGWRLVKQRQVKRRKVSKIVMSGMETLKPKRYIAGDQIPVVPVYGKRRFVDGVERVRGHVRKAKDPQRVYNAQISNLTETVSLSPQERYILTPDQVAGHEELWGRMNIDRKAYALLNPVIDPATGQPVPAGPVGKIEPPKLPESAAALIQVTANDIKEMTSSDDAAAEVKSNVSAEAMDLAATRIDDKAFTYLDNFRQSMQRAGEIYLGMARDVYVEEGREVETMDADGKTPGVAVLSEPYTDDHGAYSIRNDIAAGKYKVISDVTEATTTRRDKTVRTLMSMGQSVAQYDPELAQSCTITALLSMDGEGMDDLQSWARGRALKSGLVKPTDQEKQEMEQEAQQQQPDPQTEVLHEQAGALRAGAEKDAALTDKARADTKLSGAKTVETMAKAHAHASSAHEERKTGMLNRLQSLFGPKPAK